MRREPSRDAGATAGKAKQIAIHHVQGDVFQTAVRSVLPLFSLNRSGVSSVVLSNLDRDLLARCLDGTPGAWEDFVDRFAALISHVVASTAMMRQIDLSSEARDDVVADVFLSLVDHDFRTLRRFRGQSSLGTYLVVVARRISIRKLSQLQLGRQVSHSSAEGMISDSRIDLQLENSEEVQSLLSKLGNSEATVIRMYHLEERSYREIGMHLGIPENSVGPLLSEARSKLKQMRSH